MGFNFRDFLSAMLLCLLIVIGWQWLQQRWYPPAPETPAQTPAEAPTTQTSKPAAGEPAPTVVAAGLFPDWRLMPVEGQEVILGERQTSPQGFRAQITLDGPTAALKQVLLSDYKHKVSDKQTGYPLLAVCSDDRNRPMLSLELTELKLKGRPEPIIFSPGCWQVSEPRRTDPDGRESVSFSATIVDDQDNPMLVLVRTYQLMPGPQQFDLDFQLQFINKSKQPLQIESVNMFGPMGLVREDPRGDRRHAVAGYRLPEGKLQVTRRQLTDFEKHPEKDRLDRPKGGSIQWYGTANKFFAAVVRPLPGPSGQIDYLTENQVAGRILLIKPQEDRKGKKSEQTLTASVTLTPPEPIKPNGESGFNFQLYLGPIDQDVFKQPRYAELGYEEIFFSRPCFCTFNWLTTLLLGLMKLTYRLVGNYGIAIIILVLLVRLLLHPITKKSQVNMMKMQKLQPQMEELRKKYGQNKQELSKKTMELYKDRGMAANFLLGCLPMFLQMPIWVALYTAVDGNVAVRHHGLFPAGWFPAGWQWLTDLSAPDRLIPFTWFGLTEPVHLPLLGNLVGGLDAFNLLPLLLAIAIFLQTKLTSQTSMAQTNPQAAQQQKMMMYMMPVMMLLFLYTAPSGLNLYIMASTFGGLLEQRVIRKHLKAEQAKAEATTVAATGKVSERFGAKKRKPKPLKKYFS